MDSRVTYSNSDKELIIQIKENSEIAFKELFYKYYKILITFCWYRTRNIDLSKDLVQEVFAKLWISRNNLNHEKSVKSYLFKSLTNQIINNSKLSSSKNISIDESILNSTPANNINIENQIDLHSAIEKLPEKLKTVFMLSRIEGFKYSEISEICEISIKAVEKRMTKTLKILRKSLS
ncbi:MAG: sigma-70 family RNA polymerase sigma factor [Ignavibacteriales bacterium]|nr:sigma-70 family RNA polymerase sigma factor [Ignavibacteriales bacterium]